MGEAIIARGETVDPKLIPRYSKVLKTEIITENTIWEVPGTCMVEEGVSVRIFGGGAGLGGGHGGASGLMNNTILKNLNSYQRIVINIGIGGIGNNTGGTSTFGNYLSANGGDKNGYGGASGGGTAGDNSDMRYYTPDAGQFGGGGGGSYNYSSRWYMGKGGNGGKWGGGGGGAVNTFNYLPNGAVQIIWHWGIGGQFGGNGSLAVRFDQKYAENGTNIYSLENITMPDMSIMEYRGLASKLIGGGGGGYGGCGGDPSVYNDGYGGSYSYGFGGGGGYGANGGRGDHTYTGAYIGAGGGGGGYGGKGADASGSSPGGGGGYGSANYGAGGGGKAINGSNGKQGVCIIQYYAKELV